MNSPIFLPSLDNRNTCPADNSETTDTSNKNDNIDESKYLNNHPVARYDGENTSRRRLSRSMVSLDSCNNQVRFIKRSNSMIVLKKEKAQSVPILYHF